MTFNLTKLIKFLKITQLALTLKQLNLLTLIKMWGSPFQKSLFIAVLERVTCQCVRRMSEGDVTISRQAFTFVPKEL